MRYRTKLQQSHTNGFNDFEYKTLPHDLRTRRPETFILYTQWSRDNFCPINGLVRSSRLQFSLVIFLKYWYQKARENDKDILIFIWEPSGHRLGFDWRWILSTPRPSGTHSVPAYNKIGECEAVFFISVEVK